MCRPPHRWSSVNAAIAHAVGVRADNCTTEVPSRIRRVEAPPGQRGVGVRTPRLGGEHGVEAGVLGRGHQFRRVAGRLRAPISQLESQPHSHHPTLAFTSSPLGPSLKPFLEPVLLDPVTASQSSPVQIDRHEPPLSAPLKLSFDYTRSVGFLLSEFFTALRERRIVGVRGSDGRVHVPPAEYDPVTYERLTEIVPVSSVGTVVSWSWQPQPLEGQPLDRPFAWALIKLDGADTPMLHAVNAASSDDITTGARVHAHWVDDPVGAITDIAYFALGDEAEPVPDMDDDRDPVAVLVSPISISDR